MSGFESDPNAEPGFDAGSPELPELSDELKTELASLCFDDVLATEYEERKKKLIDLGLALCDFENGHSTDTSGDAWQSVHINNVTDPWEVLVIQGRRLSTGFQIYNIVINRETQNPETGQDELQCDEYVVDPEQVQFVHRRSEAFKRPGFFWAETNLGECARIIVAAKNMYIARSKGSMLSAQPSEPENGRAMIEDWDQMQDLIGFLGRYKNGIFHQEGVTGYLR